jgi:thymidylate synthase
MKPVEYPSMHTAYMAVLTTTLSTGTPTVVRGQGVREVTSLSYAVENARDWKIDFSCTGAPERQAVYDAYVEAELAWYISGNLKAASAPSKFWGKLADADGNIVSNYGYMMLHRKRADGMTEYEAVIKALCDDQYSRKAVLHYATPDNTIANKLDQPCTLSAVVFARDGELHMHVTQRSLDAILGLPYDSAWHCWLIGKLAEDTGFKPGRFIHTVVNCHVYERHYDLAGKILS